MDCVEYDLLGRVSYAEPIDIINVAVRDCPPWNNSAVLILFSGGNDSRAMAHVVKPILESLGMGVELAAIDTGLGVDGWRDSIVSYSEWLGVNVSFWSGEGRGFYSSYVARNGFPSSPQHGLVQNRLKGRAMEKMVRDRRGGGKVSRVWLLSGIRQLESRKRMGLISPFSRRGNGQFINPLFYWSNSKVADYLNENNIPLSAYNQGDCKCGATVRSAKAEMSDIRDNNPCLFSYLSSLGNVEEWGKPLSRRGVGNNKGVSSGKVSDYNLCVSCVSSLFAKDELGEW